MFFSSLQVVDFVDQKLSTVIFTLRDLGREMIRGGKSFVSSQPAFSNDAKRLLVCTGNTVSVFSTDTGLQVLV